jgi:D-alanyl-D-alanine carboxypeptidase
VPRTYLPFLLLVTLLLDACGPRGASISTPTPTGTATAIATASPSQTATATATPSPTASPTLFPLPSLEATIAPCDQRRPTDLYAEVTASFGIASGYVPPDLVWLGGYVSGYVTLPDLMLRQEAAQALGRMVKAMKAEGLSPTVLSAYRSYADQAVAYNHWQTVDPAHAAEISQPPGHSEHQLGTTVDFGSPEMPALTGDPAEKLGPQFALTDEGEWLAAHAHEYGFTMTNPQGAERLTGLTYEPWHYRYVGADLATYLHVSGYFLTQYLSLARPELPCTPE